MPTAKKILIAGLLALVPLSASAQLFPFSFGGRVASVIPCSAGLHVTIIPSGAFPVSYIWTPATVTFTAGPPRNPGQQLLGLADAPFVCFIGSSPPIPLFGLRMQMVGTSLGF